MVSWLQKYVYTNFLGETSYIPLPAWKHYATQTWLLERQDVFPGGQNSNVMKGSRTELSEIRWTVLGELKTTTGECILYCGSEEDHKIGVGLVSGKMQEQHCTDGTRPMTGLWVSRYAELTVRQLNAPTTDAEESMKDELYDQLQEKVERTPGHDALIITSEGPECQSW